ncbi:hypothetical protein C8R45DRAFT_1011670 [Mycena sanguinolenta]|nr:hypothetical protein C8R45DRAFT_1011670 [Mycena sanguinolenta]
MSMPAAVKMGSVLHWPSSGQFEDATEIASVVADPLRALPRWNYGSLGMLREDGSVRCNSRDVFGEFISTTAQAHDTVTSWLSQANYIFTCLGPVSNYEAYVLVDWVSVSLFIPVPERDPPAGYLFLPSLKNFATGPASCRWPAYHAYWSLDPFGSDPLSIDKASNLGFPSIELTTGVNVKSWDDAAYAGLRKFHEGKGVDPDSQDVARGLGYSLYELSVPVMGVQEQNLADQDDESDRSTSSDGFIQEDPLKQTLEFADCNMAVAEHCSFGALVELLKFTLIVVAFAMHLYEQAKQIIF